MVSGTTVRGLVGDPLVLGMPLLARGGTSAFKTVDSIATQVLERLLGRQLKEVIKVGPQVVGPLTSRVAAGEIAAKLDLYFSREVRLVIRKKRWEKRQEGLLLVQGVQGGSDCCALFREGRRGGEE